MKAALDGLLPALIGPPPAFEVYNYGSKQQLLAKLPDRLRGYAGRLRSGEDLRVVVLVDRDEQDCLDLKRALEATAATAGLRTRTAARQHGFAGFEALTRVVCEELESWYFGDPAAVRAAYAR